MQMIVKAASLQSGESRRYVVPSLREAMANSNATHGEQFDPVERKRVHGGLPMVWPAVH